ncbi:sigma-70 family RNA polymerase sigma factor [Alkalibacterium sp. s-m-22]|uniref:Sigma-70 family RNA polymerase sigma factor n=1 Tax=Alkalibacterium indicireducens TaxID=398758 RepID=A0ABP3KS46_9LACT
MKRKLTEEMEHDFFFVHESIVYGVLRKCGIRFNHPDYDDYVQIGLLKLVEAYETFPEDLCQEAYFYQFTGYAFQKIRWGIIDEMRKAIKNAERETLIGEALDRSVPEEGVESDSDWLVWELMPTMLKYLTPNEQQYLRDAAIDQLSITDIAKKHNVSRKTVYEWRKKTAIKLAHFKAVLKS